MRSIVGRYCCLGLLVGATSGSSCGRTWRAGTVGLWKGDQRTIEHSSNQCRRTWYASQGVVRKGSCRLDFSMRRLRRRGAVAAVVTYSSCFLETNFPLCMRAALVPGIQSGSRPTSLGWRKCVSVQTSSAMQLARASKREFASELVTILVALDPADSGRYRKRVDFSLNTLKQVII